MDIRLDLGRNTHIKITHLGEVVDCADGSGSMPLNYVFLSRGTLSRYQIKKTLNRFVLGLLWEFLAKSDTPSAAIHIRHATRDRAWISRHIRVLSAPTQPVKLC